MAKILPFKAIRPTRDKVQLVASQSVMAYPKRIVNAILDSNPYSFLQIIKPQRNDAKKAKVGSVGLFKKVKKRFNDFIKEGVFIQDEIPAYYIYRQEKLNSTYCGIIAATSIDDYLEGKIKVHEHTITKREQMFKNYLDICDFNAEPVLLTYPKSTVIENVIAQHITSRPEYDYSSTDRIRHQLWVMDDLQEIAQIQKEFEGINEIYIADGHHRTASSALLGVDRRKKKKNYSGNEKFNFFMSYFIPDNQLDIYDFNRVVKDLNHLCDEDFLDAVKKSFRVEKKSKLFKPNKIHTFSMYFSGNWYALHSKLESFDNNSPTDRLDSHILTQNLLHPILNIKDLKTNKRVNFVGGLLGHEKLQKLVDSGKYRAAFGLYPVQVAQLKEIADNNCVMPPKSTWIEPKLRSGVVIYKT